MRLVSIHCNFLSGFGHTPPISLDSPLVIFYGPNGSGKTAIAEALEWLLYGTTRRRLHSEVDEVEHRGALRSVLCPADADPFVEAQVRLTDGQVRVLCRVLHVSGSDERTTLTIDGVEVPDLSCIGLAEAEHFRPIVLQHSLQALILCSGNTRRRFISSLLGLDSLVAFDSAVDSATARLLNALPSDVAEPYEAFLELRTLMSEKDTLPALQERWSSDHIEYPADYDEILGYCREALQMPDDSLEDIQERAAEAVEAARRAIFDITPFAPRQELTWLSASLNEHVMQVCTEFEHLSQSLANYAEARAQIFARLQFALDLTRLTFWQTGLGLLEGAPTRPDETVRCPFCEELSITT